VRRDAAIGAAIVAIVSIAVVAPHVFPLTSISTVSYDWLDADLFLWNFWWTKHALATAQSPYWTELLIYPSGASLAFHSYPMPYGLLTLVVQSVMSDAQGLAVSFNLMVLLSSMASGLGAFFLALRVTRHVPSAIVAGLVFACAPYRALNISRLHVLATEVLAWYVWGWIGFADTPTRARAIGLGAILALAFHTSPEYALHAAGFSVLWLAWAPTRRALNAPFWRQLALAAIVFTVLASPLLMAQARSLARHQAAPTRSLDEISSWSPAAVSLFTPSRVQPVYGHLFSSAGDYGAPGVAGMRSETAVAFTIWLLVIAAITRIRKDGSQFWLVAAVVFLAFTLGPNLRLTGTLNTAVPLPYALFYWFVPPLQVARDPTRFFAMTLLMLSVLSAFGVRALLDRVRGRLPSQLAAAAIGALVVFEGLTASAAKVSATDLICSTYDVITATPGDFAVLDLSPDQTALLAQTRHGRPITAGRVSNPRAAATTPTGVERDFMDAGETLALDPAALGARLQADRQELERLNVRFVVFPAGDEAKLELARRLGLSVVASGDRVVCSRP